MFQPLRFFSNSTSAVGGTARGVDMLYTRNSYGHLAAMPLALAGVPVFAVVFDFAFCDFELYMLITFLF